MESKNIFRKMQDVTNSIKGIQKNMTVGTGTYQYKAVSDADVIKAINKAEKDAGLISVPIGQDLVSTEIVKALNKQGNESVTYVDVVKMTLRIYDIDNPKVFVDVESYGRGLDGGDKGFGKAATYARKYALLNAYKIPTGVDPDEVKSQKTETKRQNTQKDAVINYLAKDFSYAMQIKQHYVVDSVDELTDSQIASIYNNMLKKGLL